MFALLKFSVFFFAILSLSPVFSLLTFDSVSSLLPCYNCLISCLSINHLVFFSSICFVFYSLFSFLFALLYCSLLSSLLNLLYFSVIQPYSVLGLFHLLSFLIFLLLVLTSVIFLQSSLSFLKSCFITVLFFRLMSSFSSLKN